MSQPSTTQREAFLACTDVLVHFQPSYAIDGLRHTTSDGGNFWRDEHGLPSWLEVDFNGSETINEIDVITSQNYPDYSTGADPTPSQTFNGQGAAAFDVQYWNGPRGRQLTVMRSIAI